MSQKYTHKAYQIPEEQQNCISPLTWWIFANQWLNPLCLTRFKWICVIGGTYFSGRFQLPDHSWHHLSYDMCRTSKSILPPKMATRLISRLTLFSSPHLVLGKVVPAWAWSCFVCKEQCCSKPGAARLTVQSFRKGIRRRTWWMLPLQGWVHSCFPGLPQFGLRGGFGPQDDSLFTTCQVCSPTQAPSQWTWVRDSGSQQEQEHVCRHWEARK